jgi:phenylalanine-4-hydroxylase
VTDVLCFPVVAERPELLPGFEKQTGEQKLAMKSGNASIIRTFNYNVFDMNATIESNPLLDRLPKHLKQFIKSSRL